MPDKIKISHRIWKPLLFVAICCIIIIVLIYLFKENASYSSDESMGDQVESLACNASAPIAPFFQANTSSDVEHKIKITFKNEKANKFFYDLSGKYPNKTLAGNDASRFGVQYDLYMSENGVSSKKLFTNFSSIENELSVVLYTGINEINSVIAPIFFLTENFDKIPDYSIKDFYETYETKGFSCMINNQFTKEENE